MILVFGGTTEGRKAVELLEEAGKPYFYSTKGNVQELEALYARHISGALDRAAICQLCQEQGIELLIDAAHPFAEALHQNIAMAAEDLGLPVIRLERIYPARSPEILWCRNYQEAVEQMLQDGVQRLLMLTGLNTIPKLSGFWQKRRSYCRILNRPSSIDGALAHGFPEEQLLFWKENDDERVLRELQPDAIITKESGKSGYFDEKVAAALRMGIKVYAVERPKLSESFRVVNGPVGLRLEIQRIMGNFFPQRMGLSTGSTATAACVAAMELLLYGKRLEKAYFELPSGETVSLCVEDAYMEGDWAVAVVLKDAGDDPDVTDKTAIELRLSLQTDSDQIRFLQGEGVGVVTKPGLGIAIGGPAINNTPRAMISHEIRKRYPIGGVDVCISVPQGRELARKTFNPRLGIVDGISIIGTTGVVKPFSSEAFIAAIRQQIEVAKAAGAKELVINSGGKSEGYLRKYFDKLPTHCFVQYGNFVGETLSCIAELGGIEQVNLGIMIGKAVKLAAGHLDTHSKHTVMNKLFLAEMAESVQCSQRAIDTIAELNMARQLWAELDKADRDKLFPAICQASFEVCKKQLPESLLRLLLIDEEGNIAYTHEE